MINAIIHFSIQRRFLSLFLMVIIIASGIWSYKHLPIDAVPDITNTQVQINTAAPGYSPLEVEQRITYPIENALYGLPELEYTRSVSRYGLSQVTVVFKDSTDIYFARNLINTKLNALSSVIPEGTSPEMGPISTGLGEIFMYTLEADKNAVKDNGEPYSITDLREIQDWIIKPQLAQVPGVVEVNSIGGFNKQYHIEPNPAKMLYYNISFEDIVKALKANNENKGAGYIELNGQQLLVRSPGQLTSIDDISNVIIKEVDSTPVAINDIATVVIGRELRSGTATRNGHEAVLGTAMMLIGENSREVAQNVNLALTKLQSSLPQGVSAVPVYDRTQLVDKAIQTVSKNLIEGALLVIVILFLMLGNIRAALITAAVIPLSMLMTITGMVQTRVSANLMSLGALDFGLIVDGAVIIVENAIRRLSHAYQLQSSLTLKERLNIVYDATTEVIKPSIFGIIIITAVYIPIFTLSGVEGKMFHPMAATVIMALIAALLLSLTLIPAAIAIFLNKPIIEKDNIVVKSSVSLYKPALSFCLKYQKSVLGAAVALVVLSGFIATRLGSEFMPQLDEGDIALHAMRIPGTSLEQSLQMQEILEQKIIAFPEVKDVFARIGTAEVATDPMPPNVADNFVILNPRDQWPNPNKSKETLVQEIEKELGSLLGNNYEFTQPIQMRFNELISGVRADVGIKIFGDDMDTLLSTANQILTIIQSIEGSADAKVEQVSGLPTVSIEPNRIALGRYGLNVSDLQEWISAAVGGENAGLLYQGDRRFDIVVRLDQKTRTDIERLKYLPVPLNNGEFVPLEEIATISIAPAPAQISRENGKRRIVVTTNVRGRDLGSFVTDAETAINQKLAIPAGYWIDFGGTFEQLE
ncbi:MAG TPA: CusA/CzcA family heavy metal efflux RND transporter, partial [Gammaproteobacteria bacterium]|nr:CusA/CzcA family heavy metal efflux RND transporter [Gammaproteobacteria bacterium]